MDREEMLALAVELANELADAAATAEDAGPDGPIREWCGAVVPDGASAFAPYCSEACQAEQQLDEYIALTGEDPRED